MKQEVKEELVPELVSVPDVLEEVQLGMEIKQEDLKEETVEIKMEEQGNDEGLFHASFIIETPHKKTNSVALSKHTCDISLFLRDLATFEKTSLF